MSTTVDDLMDFLQDIPDSKVKLLFPALNRAITLIAKRLYVLESDLAIGNMEVSLFDLVDYTASTIAFVNGGSELSDTITDTASQFVTEGFAVDMPITTNSTGNEGPLRITAVAAALITLDASESTLTSAGAGSSITLTSVDEFGYLPSDFWGLIDKPYINGLTTELDPLPSQETKLVHISASTPLYYKLIGNRLYVTPPTNANITVKGEYWQKPAKLTKMDDYLPWNELFDDALADFLTAVLMKGVPPADEALKLYMYDAVDLIVSKRPKRAPVKMPAGILWNDL